jgi:hypothetical protein
MPFCTLPGGISSEEQDYALNWDAKTTTWAIKGARDYTGSDEWLEVIELLREHGALNIREMVELLHPGTEVKVHTPEYQAVKQIAYVSWLSAYHPLLV